MRASTRHSRDAAPSAGGNRTLKTRGRDGGLSNARRHNFDHNFLPLIVVNRVIATREPSPHRYRSGRENAFCAKGFDLAFGLDLRIFQRGTASLVPHAPCRSGWQARRKIAATKGPLEAGEEAGRDSVGTRKRRGPWPESSNSRPLSAEHIEKADGAVEQGVDGKERALPNAIALARMPQMLDHRVPADP